MHPQIWEALQEALEVLAAPVGPDAVGVAGRGLVGGGAHGQLVEGVRQQGRGQGVALELGKNT